MLGRAVFCVCFYECAALVSGRRIPTVTAIAHRHRHRTVGQLAIWALLVGGYRHFLLAPITAPKG